MQCKAWGVRMNDFRMMTLLHYSRLRTEYMAKARRDRERAAYWVGLARHAQHNLTMVRRMYVA
jgi:hypothetical protein